ncbi:hypothetical protein PBI_PERCIVAL_44 [Microbacterium phage Percival]|uniref:Uncharacterized protein n=1 Tax=Microbacterium phage Percival TaxID=2201439 RepID=A0A2Z4Q6R7_9CAUD|nr:hypothetical protein PBI_PERCIVAL_44 [Microbacterium phage Percival]
MSCNRPACADLHTAPDGTYSVQPWGLQPLTPGRGFWVALRPVQVTCMATPNLTVGVWTSPEGERCLDVTTWVEDPLDALTLAAAHGQTHVWDIAKDMAMEVTPL